MPDGKQTLVNKKKNCDRKWKKIKIQFTLMRLAF